MPTSFESRGEEPSYLNSLMNSMSLVLDEFYKNITAVGVSSATGDGMDAFLDAISKARTEYIDEVRPELEKLVAEKRAQLSKSQDDQMKAFLKDMSLREPRSGLAKVRAKQHADPDDMDPQYDGDGVIVDPDSDEEKPEYGAPDGDERLNKRWNQLDGTYWPTSIHRSA